MKSQYAKIRDRLESGKSITPLQALRLYGCFRLGARVYDLRQAGMNIKTETIKRNGKQYAKYTLE